MTVVDPSSLLANSNNVVDPKDNDIQEDPRDRFISTRSGKRRPMLMSDSESSEWADDAPAQKIRKLVDEDTGSIAARVLSRVKRCGGGGDDDGGNARRARRARRARAARRARKAAARAQNSVQSTTVTKKIYQNNQLVSETSYAQPAGHQVIVPAGAPPMVQSVAAAPVQHQPVIIQQQPVAAPIVQQAPAPQVVQQQQAGNLPSISVQGSVKVN